MRPLKTDRHRCSPHALRLLLRRRSYRKTHPNENLRRNRSEALVSESMEMLGAMPPQASPCSRRYRDTTELFAALLYTTFPPRPKFYGNFTQLLPYLYDLTLCPHLHSAWEDRDRGHSYV